MIYAYTRVSTNTQTLENQEYGIKEYCKMHSMHVDMWFEEHAISGKILAKNRELGVLVDRIKPGDTVICTEISRIGRSTPDVLNTMKIIKEKGATLIAIKQNFVLDDTLSAKILGYIFTICAEIERDILSARVKEGLASRKAKGQKLGRPFGSKNKHSKLRIQKEFIEMCLQTNKSRYYIKKHLKCHSHTLNKYLKTSGLAKKYNIAISNKLWKYSIRNISYLNLIL